MRNEGASGDSGDMDVNLERSSTDLDHFFPAVARRSPMAGPECTEAEDESGMERAS